MPWGILIGGEELHNNHHAYATSAKFSIKWYEFDIGWMYIRMLETLGLAEVKKVAPTPRFADAEAGLRRADAAGRHHAPLRSAREVREIAASAPAREELERLRPLVARSMPRRSSAEALHRAHAAAAPRSSARSSPSALKSSQRARDGLSRCATSSRRCGSARPLRRSSSCTSSKTGASAPKPAASARLRNSRAACAATPEPLTHDQTKKPAKAGFFVVREPADRAT